MKSIVLLLLPLSLAYPASAAGATPGKKWKNAAELSIVSTNGNSKTQTTSAKNVFSYQFAPATSLEIDAAGLGARSNGVVTAEQYFAGEKATRKVDDRNYLFEKYRWDRNRFAGIAHRHDFSAGAGREVWKTPSDLLIAEVAPGYVVEQRLREPRTSFATARAYAKYTREFSATARFGQDAEWIQSLEDKRDSRFNSETSLTAALNSVFSIKNSFIWRHNSRPPAGFSKDDEILSVALIAAF